MGMTLASRGLLTHLGHCWEQPSHSDRIHCVLITKPRVLPSKAPIPV